jgi:hypothetical protein
MVGGKDMKRIRVLAAFLTFFSASLFLGEPAFAGQQWCEEDPTFLVNGSLVDVTTAFPAAYASKIKGSVHFDLQVPSNVIAAVVSLPGAVPVTASISRTLPRYTGIGRLPVVITVTMNASVAFPTYTRAIGTTGTILAGYSGDSRWPTRARFTMIGLGL